MKSLIPRLEAVAVELRAVFACAPLGARGALCDALGSVARAKGYLSAFPACRADHSRLPASPSARQRIRSARGVDPSSYLSGRKSAPGAYPTGRGDISDRPRARGKFNQAARRSATGKGAR